MTNNELYHHGVKGQRWGVRRTLAQLGHRQNAKRKASADSRFSKLAGKKKPTASSSSLDKKAILKEEKARKEQESIQQKKEKLLKSGDPTAIYKNKHLFSTDEINYVVNRINTEQKLQALAQSSKSGKSYVTKAANTMNNVSNLVQNGGKAWDNFAKLYNTLSENGRKNPLPYVNGNNEKKKTDQELMLEKMKAETDMWNTTKNYRNMQKERANYEMNYNREKVKQYVDDWNLRKRFDRAYNEKNAKNQTDTNSTSNTEKAPRYPVPKNATFTSGYKFEDLKRRTWKR